ncbi:MAG: winged helix-turn-helix domain-containing protein [Candidatus Nanohaloarchaea archaeon]
MSLLNKNVEKVLDVLLDHPNVGYSKKELAEAAEISRSSLYRIWPTLEKNGIVVEEKRYGNTVLYSLNVESELVNHLGRIIDAQEEWEEKAVEA